MVTRRGFLIGAGAGALVTATGAYGAISVPNIVAPPAVDDGFINPMWRKMVNIQDIGERKSGLVYALDYRFTDDPVEIPGGFGTGRPMTLEITSHAIADEEFIYDDDTIAQAVKEVIMSFPKPDIKHQEDDPKFSVFEVRANCNGVARKTRRGAANTNLYGSWYYQGTNGVVDGGFCVVSRTIGGKNQYAIWKSHRFEDYGYHFDAPINAEHDGYEYHVHTTYHVDDDKLTHMPLTEPQDSIKIYSRKKETKAWVDHHLAEMEANTNFVHDGY